MQDRLYSPTQVAVGSFFGGPIAMVYFLWENYVVLEQRARANQMLVGGGLFVLALLAFVIYLPDDFPNFLIPVAYTVAARYVAEKTQMSKRQIEASPHYTFQSGWRVAGIAVALLIAFLVLIFGWVFALDGLGIVSLDEL